MLPLVLLVLVLAALAFTLSSALTGSPLPKPVPVALVALAVALTAWWFISRANSKPLGAEEFNLTTHSAMGQVLAREALDEFPVGKAIILVHPRWTEFGATFVSGVTKELAGQTGFTFETVAMDDWTSAADQDPDGTAIAREYASRGLKADALILAFPVMGELGGTWPRLPPIFCHYDGMSNNWRAHLKSKRFHAVIRRGIVRLDKAPEHPAMKLLSQRHILVTPENLDRFDTAL